MAKPALDPESEVLEIPHRTAVVRTAKIRKTRLGLGPDLTPDELDAIFPPIDCWLTRARLARKAAPEGCPCRD